MNKVVGLNVFLNFVFGLIFVFLNNWALKNGMEETFVSLAIFYGAVTLVGNAVYVLIFCKK